jgi:pyrimidine operon attenuation protein/uracil phosphoribosyltransferase
MTALPAIDVADLIEDMAERLAARIAAQRISDPAMIGIRTGGVWVARALHQRLGLATPLGELNIAYYRDDFSHSGVHPTVEPSQLPFAVDERDLLLVDDILYTGRTVRAAMNEIFDWGRPRSISLVVLIDRGGRELPIDANVYGARIKLGAGEHVKLHGPDPLTLELVSK